MSASRVCGNTNSYIYHASICYGDERSSLRPIPHCRPRSNSRRQASQYQLKFVSNIPSKLPLIISSDSSFLIHRCSTIYVTRPCPSDCPTQTAAASTVVTSIATFTTYIPCPYVPQFDDYTNLTKAVGLSRPLLFLQYPSNPVVVILHQYRSRH